MLSGEGVVVDKCQGPASVSHLLTGAPGVSWTVDPNSEWSKQPSPLWCSLVGEKLKVGTKCLLYRPTAARERLPSPRENENIKF